MTLNPIAVAIPVFLAAIGGEVWVAGRRRLPAFRFVDAVTDLGCGIGNQAMALVFTPLLLAGYAALHAHASLVHFAKGSPWPWVIAFVGLDFVYYWWHRFSHEVNLLWAAHVVHHQSEDYNLAVALRQALFTGFTVIPFYWALAFVGVPVLPYAISAAVSLLYQFWIHTEVIGRLPAPIEWLFNTPSHHRVHHATNPEYLDKNYGAILIVWDRLFGTFEPERAPCVYGITKPFGSFDPIWANFANWAELVRLARSRRGWGKVKVFFERPGYDPATGEVQLPPFVARERFVKFDVPAPSRALKVWIAAQMGLLVAALVALLSATDLLSRAVLVGGAVAMVVATLCWSWLLTGRRWAWPAELARVAGSVAFAGLVLGGILR